MYIVLKSFAGKEYSGTKGKLIEIKDKDFAKSLIKAGFIAEYSKQDKKNADKDKEIVELKSTISKLTDENTKLEEEKAELILTTGGTGFSERDVTPEATEEVIERKVPGIPEAIRAYSMTITKRAMLSRATAGIRGKTLIINLPGSPKAVRESLEYIIDALGHGIEILTGEAGNCARK